MTTGILALALLAGPVAGVEAASLEGIAVLPADTFAVGPTSGQFIDPANGRVPPFFKRQTYPNSAIPVDPAIRHGRLLTGADFDIESFREAPDGTFWFGDEFGPFLLHTDADGRLLERPIPLPGVQSADNPFLGSGTPNLPRSRGFEGMAITPNGRYLYPMLEGSLTTDPDQQRLIISQFDRKRRAYTSQRWFYRLDAPTGSGQAIGDLTAVNDKVFLVIERDGGQGPTAQFKKILLVNLDRADAAGFLVKHEVADLLNLRDPDNLGGTGAGTFAFPFTTIESVIPLSPTTIGVLNDNNYPFSSGRTPGHPDNNEFIVIGLDERLPLKGDAARGADHDD